MDARTRFLLSAMLVAFGVGVGPGQDSRPASRPASLDVIRVDAMKRGRIIWCTSAVATAFDRLERPDSWRTWWNGAASRPSLNPAPDAVPESRLVRDLLAVHMDAVPACEPDRPRFEDAFYSGRGLEDALDQATRTTYLSSSKSRIEAGLIRPILPDATRWNAGQRGVIAEALEKASASIGSILDDAATEFRMEGPIDVRVMVLPSEGPCRIFVGEDYVLASAPPRPCDAILLRAAIGIAIGRRNELFSPASGRYVNVPPRDSYFLAAMGLQLATRGWVTHAGEDVLASVAGLSAFDSYRHDEFIQLCRLALALRPLFEDVYVRRKTFSEALGAARDVWRALKSVRYVHGEPADIPDGWLPESWTYEGVFARALLAPTRRESRLIRRVGGIDLASDGDWRTGDIEGKAPNPVAADRLASVLEGSLALLPAGLVEKMKLRRIVICSRLAVGGNAREATVLFGSNQLVYDVELLEKGLFAQVCFFHEFFHLLDLLERHAAGDTEEPDPDPEWASLNAPGTGYGRGGAESRHNVEREPPQRGCVSWYAGSAVVEDKAEAFAWLMARPREAAKLAASDPVIAAKFALLKKRLFTYCSECDEHWWKRVAAAGK